MALVCCTYCTYTSYLLIGSTSLLKVLFSTKITIREGGPRAHMAGAVAICIRGTYGIVTYAYHTGYY